jgi:hypothetical protein
MRCRLLLGSAFSVASCSKPMVAFTTSRKISSAVSCQRYMFIFCIIRL